MLHVVFYFSIWQKANCNTCTSLGQETWQGQFWSHPYQKPFQQGHSNYFCSIYLRDILLPFHLAWGLSSKSNQYWGLLYDHLPIWQCPLETFNLVHPGIIHFSHLHSLYALVQLWNLLTKKLFGEPQGATDCLCEPRAHMAYLAPIWTYIGYHSHTYFFQLETKEFLQSLAKLKKGFPQAPK